ncbi:MAG: molecular chaperone TorD family protein [Deltaproteobacteria bacterium]|nr:molecular chaperone TorD family protein [Deltaproteobacteria bacterium]MDZ4346475.1 molecular chaperone TorD family protein [Candidatus Binatia bacterium]
MKNSSDLDARELLTLAAAWRLASLLLERPRPEWKIEIARLAAEVSDPRLPPWAADAAQATEECYHRLFGPAGAVSPREVSYCGFEDPGRLIAELSGFYHAFSFNPQREESIDHVSVETGFVGYLFLKEAYARMRNTAASAAIAKEARERFCSEHLARLARGMRARSVEMPAYLQGVLSWLNDGIEADGRPPDASVVFHEPTGPIGR